MPAGKIASWSGSVPEIPRFADSGVCANAATLAVGFYDGNVAVYPKSSETPDFPIRAATTDAV